jgi:hypothetical protein
MPAAPQMVVSPNAAAAGPSPAVNPAAVPYQAAVESAVKAAAVPDRSGRRRDRQGQPKYDGRRGADSSPFQV